MKLTVYLVALGCFSGLLGCGKHAREYGLDEESFGADTLAMVADVSGLNFPDDTKGLKFHYIPPIDPIYFAQLELPESSRESIEKQIRELADLDRFPDNFANDRCHWWQSAPQDAIVTKKAFSAGHYFEAYLTADSNRLILYLKCFTS